MHDLFNSSKYVIVSARIFLLSNEAPRQFCKNNIVTRQRGAEWKGCKTVLTYMEAY
jgi:hypothetical protein